MSFFATIKMKWLLISFIITIAIWDVLAKLPVGDLTQPTNPVINNNPPDSPSRSPSPSTSPSPPPKKPKRKRNKDKEDRNEIAEPLPDPETSPPSLFASPSAAIHPTPNFNPDADAQTLVGDINKALKEMFVMRTFKERQEIFSAYKKNNPTNPFYLEEPQLLQDEFEDLKKALTEPLPIDLALDFLHACLELHPLYWWGSVIIALLGIADIDRKKFMDLYFQRFGVDIAHGIEKQAKDYKNFLYEISEWERELDSKEFTREEVGDMAKRLFEGCENWNDNRQALDEFVIGKSKRFIRVVFPTFLDWYEYSLYDAIDENIEEHNLKIGYKFLIDYAINYHTAVATRFHDSFCEPFVQGAMKIATILAFSESTLPDINLAFQEKYQISMRDFLLSKSGDSVNQALAAMVEKYAKVSAPPTEVR